MDIVRAAVATFDIIVVVNGAVVAVFVVVNGAVVVVFVVVKGAVVVVFEHEAPASFEE